MRLSVRPTYRRVTALLAVGILSAGFAACGSDDDTANDAGDSTAVTAAPDREDKAFGEVTVSGTKLPEFKQGDDAAVGQTAPVLTMEKPDSTTGTVGGPGEPTLIAFLAHWCPHCQREVPVLVKAQKDGKLAGVRVVAIATSTNDQAPNFPPVKWLDEESWAGDIFLDTEDTTAAAAYGLTGFPYLVAVDANGKVTARASGELSASQLEALAATAT